MGGKTLPYDVTLSFAFCSTRFGPVKGSFSMIHDELLPHSSSVQVYLIVFAKRSKQRCQDLGWKVHDRAQSFVLRSYTMHELRNQHIATG